MEQVDYCVRQVGEVGPYDNVEKYIRRKVAKRGDPSTAFQDNTYNIRNLMEGLRGSLHVTAPLEFHIMPNYHWGYNRPSTGWAMKLRAETDFNHDMLMAEEFFRVMTLVEIEKPVDPGRFQEVCRMCIPVDDGRYDTISWGDNDGSGWTPVLAERGAALAYLVAKWYDKDQGEQKDRHFLMCDSGLTDTTIHMLQNDLIEKGNEMYEKRLSPNSGFAQGARVWTNQEVFLAPDSRLSQMRECSREQNVRLLCILMRGLGIVPLRDMICTHQERERRFADSRPTNEAYRPSRLRAEASDKLISSNLARMLELWPRGAPIYPFSIIKLDGKEYPLGDAVRRMAESANSDGPNAVAAQANLLKMEQKFNFKFISHPETFVPNIETVYNDFERTFDGNIIWRSNNARVSHPDGVIKKCALSMGYEVINSRLFFPESVREWTNQHLDSFPVIDPFESDEGKVVQEDLLAKFKSIETTTAVPSQLKGSYFQDIMSPQVQNILAPPAYVEYPVIRLEPVVAFLSSGVQSQPRFEL